MPEKYQWLDLEFLYPETWEIDEDPDSATIMIQSPSGAFLSMTRPRDLQSAFERARLTMEQEYGEMETDSITRILDEALMEGITQRFIYLDFVVTSHLYKLETEDLNFPSLLIQYQGEDRDLDRESSVFDAIVASMLRKAVID